MFEKFRKNLSRVIYSARNSMSLPNQFLRFGNQKSMTPDWAEVMMRDEDHYTGYSYAAITKRARAVARVASQFVITEQPDDKDKQKTDSLHPYLPLIRESKLFSENMFWQTISTYLDLEGWFYLMVLRNPDAAKNPTGTGDLGIPKQFKLLNPYNIQRILKQDTLEVGGYRETRKGFQREIPAEMIIPIMELNPFDEDKPYAMTDAARESSYTLKSSGDYTRHTLRNNVDAPGIITTDVILPEPEFKNFVARMKDHTKGEPVFGNGASAVKWTPMTNDLSKSALKDITEVNRDQSFAVFGMSKTMMGIEQSGTTRETSNVQKDLFIENEIVPRINLVLDALNLDYKNRYAKEYDKSKFTLGINNPIESDQDVEVLKVDNKTKNFELFTQLVDAGYDEAIAAQYANGEIDLSKLGKPTNEPKPKLVMPGIGGDVLLPPKPKKKSQQALLQHFKNEISRSIIEDQESLLQNAVVNIEGSLAAAAVNRIPQKVKNAIEEESDVVTKEDKKQAVNELLLVLTAFYGVIAAIQGREVLKDREEKYGLGANWTLDKIAKEVIKKTAQAVAESHVDTVSEDLYKTAREAALKGKGQQEIISELKTKYSHDITENRAKAVARSETNRAFTMAQYDADRMFISQNGLESRAFKRYNTRSANPCPFCLQLQSQGLIPFGEAFVKKGDTVTATIDGVKKTFNVNFQNVYAGNLHTNCSCDYELVIMDES